MPTATTFALFAISVRMPPYSPHSSWYFCGLMAGCGAMLRHRSLGGLWEQRHRLLAQSLAYFRRPFWCPSGSLYPFLHRCFWNFLDGLYPAIRRA